MKIPFLAGGNAVNESSGTPPQSLNNDPYAQPETQSADDHKIVDWVNKQHSIIKQGRGRLEMQWQMNLSFYFGKQNVVYRPNATTRSSSTGMLWEPPAPYYRVRSVINRIRPTVRTEMAKLTSSKPNAYIIPATSEAIDLSAAQAGEQIWDSMYRRKELNEVLKRCIFWTLTTGNGFIKCFWDPDQVDRESDQLGDIRYEPLSPFHVLVPDMTVERLEDQPFIMHAYTQSWERLKFMYPELTPPRTNAAQDVIVDPAWLNMMGADGNYNTDKVLCLEVWVKPQQIPMFPDGAILTVIGDQLVQKMFHYPYDHHRFPFVKVGHIPGGKFYSDSSIIDLIPLQREYNRTRSQIVEAKNLMAKPQLIAQQGSVDPSKITTEPGQVILVKPGFEMPRPLQLQSLPLYVIQELERILMDWADISGQHEVTNGQVPPGVTAATAISYLQEQDESKLSHTVSSIETAIEQLAQMTLSYVVQYWDTTRMVKPVGTDMQFDVLALKGSDLRGNTDIKVEAGSALPISRAAKQAFIMDLMDRGYIPPTEGLEVMDMGGINTIYERLQVDKRQIQRENILMSKVTPEMFMMHDQSEIQKMSEDQGLTGDPGTNTFVDPNTGQTVMPQIIIPVNTWDSHELHIDYHNMYRKSQSFMNLPKANKDLFEAHVQQHLEALQVKTMGGQMGQMAAMMSPEQIMMGGAPGGQPSPEEGMPPMPPVS